VYTPVSGSPAPVSSSPAPISGAPRPISGAPRPVSPGVGESYGTPWDDSSPPPSRYPPIGSGIRTRRSRLPLIIGVLLLVVAVAGAGGAAYYFVLRDDGRGGPPTTSRSTPPSLVASAEPQVSPSQPGVEPPKAGEWPAAWPKFADTDQTRTMSKLPGLQVDDFQVPQGWDCAEAFRNDTVAKYTCQPPIDGGDAIGGEVIVRTCQEPCDADRRVKMRRAEEAWGLRWTRAGGFLSWAETNKVNGSNRYGLVYVAYWRSVADGPINRQLVFRMTSPADKADDIRKVANSLRDALR
jgi:hypothetical protein